MKKRKFKCSTETHAQRLARSGEVTRPPGCVGCAKGCKYGGASASKDNLINMPKDPYGCNDGKLKTENIFC